MSKLKYNVKFPCGYEISMEINASLLGSAHGEFDEEKFKVCPLHGKNCQPKENNKMKVNNLRGKKE